jgi:hypothetical protein
MWLIFKVFPITPNSDCYARSLDIDEKRFAVFAESRSGKFARFLASSRPSRSLETTAT